jgi:hypothetical protein
MKDHLILNDSIYAERQYPLELLPPQSDFQGKIFLRKIFHPFSGLFQWTGPVGIINGTTERVKIFPQKNFAWKSDWAGGAPGDKLIFSLYDKLVITQKLSNSQVICCKEAQLSLSSYYSQRNLVRVLVLN